jgi:glycosyltransferase involved in cell wall biosynthesis
VNDGAAAPASRHLLHLFSTFTAGGPQVRTATIVKALDASFRHTIVGLDGDFSCRARLEGHPRVSYADPPRKSRLGAYSLRLGSLVARTRPDLVLTYNWGAIEALLGARLRGFRRLIHGEDGFGPDESGGQHARRIWFRRLVLPLASRVVVPSRVLLRHLEATWHVSEAKRRLIPNGVDLEHYVPESGEMSGARQESRAAIRATWRVGADDLVVGTVARFRKEKGVELLVRAFAEIVSGRVAVPGETSGARMKLVLVGDGPEEASLRALVGEFDLGSRVVFAGAMADARDAYRGFDVFAISSHTEQMPIALVEAMGCALPVASCDVGDVASMVSAGNRELVVAGREPRVLAAAVGRLLGDAPLRERLGRANRDKALSEYRVETMVERYRALYEEVLAS